MFKRYFEDELEYIRELGADFARRHPAAAAELALGGRDPEVGRMLQGFAFLAARVRQALDSSYPELRHPLLEHLWPPALRPTPAMGILELHPMPGRCRTVLRVARGSLVESRPIDGTPCRFRTCYDVSLWPVSLEKAAIEAPDPRKERLRIQLRLLPGASLKGVGATPLRLHLHGSGMEAYRLYFALRRRLTGIHLEARGADGQSLFNHHLEPAALRPVGGRDDETLLPYPPGSLKGLRHLLEYFLLDRKHLFVDLTGLEPLEGLRNLQTLQLSFELEGGTHEASPLTVSREHVRLHCVPVVNLFTHPAQPLSPDLDRAEYRLRPEGDSSGHYEIYGVEHLQAYSQSAARIVPILPAYGFRRTQAKVEDVPLFYRLRRQPAVARVRSGSETSGLEPGVDTYLSFVAPTGEPAALRSPASADLLVSNGELPRRLRPGDLCVPTIDIPPSVTVRDLGPITRPLPALAVRQESIRYLAHPGSSWTERTDLAAFRRLLLHYAPAAIFEEEAQLRLDRRIDAIEQISARVETALLGAPPSFVYGTQRMLRIREGSRIDAADWFLFGEALHRFLVETTPSDAWTALTLAGADGGRDLVWPAELGRRPML